MHRQQKIQHLQTSSNIKSVLKIKFQQTAGPFTLLHVIGHVPYWHFYKKLEGEDTDERAAKPVTTVQDCVLTFVGVKLVDVFDEEHWCFKICKHNNLTTL